MFVASFYFCMFFFIYTCHTCRSYRGHFAYFCPEAKSIKECSNKFLFLRAASIPQIKERNNHKKAKFTQPMPAEIQEQMEIRVGRAIHQKSLSLAIEPSCVSYTKGLHLPL